MGNTFRAWNERVLFQKLRQGIASDSHTDYLGHLHEFADDDLLVIDDIGSSGYTDWREEIMMELIDFRYRNSKPTVFTSNLMPSDFYKTYNKRIPSRLFSKENVYIDYTDMPDQRELGN